MPVNYNNLKEINNTISNYDKARLMAVTKNRESSDVQDLIEKGLTLFGENRVQEAQKKFKSIDRKCLELHLIGPLQTNKVKNALQVFNTIQSLDREKLVQEIKKHIDNKISITSSFYIQVNIGNELQKSGIQPNDLKDFYHFCIDYDLIIEGLMCIPPNDDEAEKYFKKMIALKNTINADLKLSMGMSNDYKIALANKSNIVRIGSLLFG